MVNDLSQHQQCERNTVSLAIVFMLAGHWALLIMIDNGSTSLNNVINVGFILWDFFYERFFFSVSVYPLVINMRGAGFLGTLYPKWGFWILISAPADLPHPLTSDVGLWLLLLSSWGKGSC